tara:strand:+ start:208 stop:906 length:699 start_codon:yes stop_codon:yes gene_type:complete
MKCHKLALLRHGESQWNLENKFTGWTNVELTKNGEIEAHKAGQLLLSEGFIPETVYSSYLKRAINTSKICLKALKQDGLDIIKDWRLNERHYGDLQGLNKTETAKKYGDEQLLLWRRSYDISPPKMSESDERHPKHDKLYENINPQNLPSGESLKDTLNRIMPLWSFDILPSIKKGENLMIVAHGNSLRAIVKILKNISNTEIVKLNIPTGIPYLFEFSGEFELLRDYYLGD